MVISWVGYILQTIFFSTIIFFIVCLCRYISGRKMMKRNAGLISYANLRMRLILLIVSSVLMLFPLSVIALMIGIVSGAIPFM